MLKKSEVLREGYLKALKEASKVISKMITEATWDNVDYVSLSSFVKNKLQDEIVFDDYGTLGELEEAGDIVGAIENISKAVNETYGIPLDEKLQKYVEREVVEYLEEAYGEKIH